jgi:hypothetical protein
MILQGLSAETLGRLMVLARQGDGYRGLISGETPEPEPQAEAEAPAISPEFRLAAE